jgi:hypothetical protein
MKRYFKSSTSPCGQVEVVFLTPSEKTYYKVKMSSFFYEALKTDKTVEKITQMEGVNLIHESKEVPSLGAALEKADYPFLSDIANRL